MMRQITPPFRLAEALNPAEPLRAVWRGRALFGQLVRKEIAAKFRHSVLGVLWLFLPPLCVLMLYIYVFSVIFRLRWPESEITSKWGFGLVIFCGITVFSMFSESVTGCIGAVTARSSCVKRVPFPLELLPAARVCSVFLVNVLVLVLLFAVSLLSGGSGSVSALALLPPVLFPLLLTTLGCGWCAAAAGVFFRDIGNLIGIVMMALFFTAPVFYSAKMVPEEYRFIPLLNPLTPVIDNVRNLLLFNAGPDLPALALSWLTGIIVFQAGYLVFAGTRRRFADVL